MNRYQIFISYRHQGGDAMAFLLKETLQARGYKVFFDSESLKSGKFDDNLLRVIEACGTVIVVLSKGALDSCGRKGDWLRREVSHAFKNKRTIIPVMMDGFEWPDKLPKDMADLHRQQGVQFSFDSFDSMMERLCSYIVEPETVSPVGDLNHLLFWADFPLGSLEKLEIKLKLPENYFIQNLSEAVEVLSRDLSCVKSVILLDTDVTKLAGNDIAIRRLNKALDDFVRDGGRLVISHDVIYRRTRNEGLQKLLGCKLEHYRNEQKQVNYVKTSRCEELKVFSSLPQSFMLTDNEVCWAEQKNMAPDVDVFFTTPDGIPLVIGHAYGKGYCLWMNSGEFSNGYPPPSMQKPEPEFIQLLRHAILDDFTQEEQA